MAQNNIGKDRAIGLLVRQCERIEPILSLSLYHPEFIKWKRDTEISIERIFGSETRHIQDFNKIRYSSSWEASGDLYRDGLSQALVIIDSFINEIDEYWVKDEPIQHSNAVSVISNICNRFHLFARQLQRRYGNRPSFEINDEYDLQDLFHAILHLHFNDIRPEEWTPSYAGGSSRIDFLIKDERLIIELKRSRPSLGTRDVGAQLMIDIQRYQTHPDCGNLICFVYDPDSIITNPRGLENDLSGIYEDIQVYVIVAPR